MIESRSTPGAVAVDPDSAKGRLAACPFEPGSGLNGEPVPEIPELSNRPTGSQAVIAKTA